LRRYLFLVRELVKRDFQSRYAGSALGFVWSLVQPIWLIALYTFVFSTVMKIELKGESTQHFSIFLFGGLLPWTALHEGVVRSATADSSGRFVIHQLEVGSRTILVAAVGLLAGCFLEKTPLGEAMLRSMDRVTIGIRLHTEEMVRAFCFFFFIGVGNY